MKRYIVILCVSFSLILSCGKNKQTDKHTITEKEPTIIYEQCETVTHTTEVAVPVEVIKEIVVEVDRIQTIEVPIIQEVNNRFEKVFNLQNGSIIELVGNITNYYVVMSQLKFMNPNNTLANLPIPNFIKGMVTDDIIIFSYQQNLRSNHNVVLSDGTILAARVNIVLTMFYNDNNKLVILLKIYDLNNQHLLYSNMLVEE